MSFVIREFDTVAVITGAYGGIGAACARRLGQRHALVLAGRDVQKLEAFAQSLKLEGYAVTTLAGDIADPVVLSRLADTAHDRGGIRALVHAAGISPVMADWRRVLSVDYIAAAQLVDAFLPFVQPGAAAVLMASTVGHREPRDARLDQLLGVPTAPDFLAGIEEYLRGSVTSARAYAIAKYGVIRLCERSANAWGERGARIMSVTPGYITTPMTTTPAPQIDTSLMQENIQHSALRRWGTPLDIAAAVEFLCSEQASYITGTDLRVDGGILLQLATRVD